ncbi:LysR substrate-binding domain-containing protein [Frigidibacter albus]|uniref:LysR substrate-binding domain-containing protein n=1 Tax=Frigidibacter albus TaxID=1465486 RepID=UPI003571381E
MACRSRAVAWALGEVDVLRRRHAPHDGRRVPAPQQPGIAGMVSAGLGIALLPASAREVLAFPDLISIPIASPSLTRDVSVVTAQGRSLSPMSKSFCSFLTKSLSEWREVHQGASQAAEVTGPGAGSFQSACPAARRRSARAAPARRCGRLP